MSSQSKWGYLISFTLPLWVMAGYYLGGWWNFITIIQVFIFLPFLDYILGVDSTNLSKSEAEVKADELFYRFITYVWVYIQFALLLWGAYVVAFGEINTWYEWTGFLLSIAVVNGGVGITVAHELGHKKNKLERFYSQALLMTVCYMHFYIEHNRGHHVYVATPEDPATARKDESYYAFWLRSIVQGYIHAWKIENATFTRKGHSPLTLKNKMVWFTVLPLIFCAVLTAVLSLNTAGIVWEVPVFFFAQALLSFSLLEAVNYIEHYGITRKEIAPGKYERVTPVHSWNADHVISNYSLFQLQRHSDHHFNAIKRYQVLESHPESPQLPAGYPAMVLLTLIPPAWFSIMNPRLTNSLQHHPQE